jgi:hypothetical protein
MKNLILLPVLVCLFLNQKTDPSVNLGFGMSNFRHEPTSDVAHPTSLMDCQKSIHFNLKSVTTVRKMPKPMWQQRQEGQLNPTPMSLENVAEFTEKSQLDICVNQKGDCNWSVSKNVGKSPIYSPLSIYVVSCLRQMSGDYQSLPDKIVSDMRAAGSHTQDIGNQAIAVQTPPHASGIYGVTLMDTSRCQFLGSSLYDKEDALKFKVIYNYQPNAHGAQILASATLITNDLEQQTVTETTTFFNRKM